jgi:hypothetical protein
VRSVANAAVHEGFRSYGVTAEVIFHGTHDWCFSPVDLATGQDRRERGLGAFKFTIRSCSLFDHAMINLRCFSPQTQSRDQTASHTVRLVLWQTGFRVPPVQKLLTIDKETEFCGRSWTTRLMIS